MVTDINRKVDKMKITTLTILTLWVLTFNLSYSQNVKSSKNKNYCPQQRCNLNPDNPAHFDPYYNHHLCENFNPEQIDFSKEYFELRTKHYVKEYNKLQQTKNYDFSPIWITRNSQQNGVLGQNYQRIQIYIEKVIVTKSLDTYLVVGKSKVNRNICGFKGSIKLLKVFLDDSCENSEYKVCGELFASYVFYEDSSKNHSGIFKGITECSFYLDKTGKQMNVDESSDGADGYWNRTFVGTWTEYKTAITRKCIWGDYRLPFTFDFDCGDGEMMVCDKYKMNGWQTFSDGSELISVGKDKWEIKNKWWLTKRK